MKILVYSLGLPPFRRGGLVNYSVDLSEQLCEAGDKVTFVYPGKIPLFNSNKCQFKKRKTCYKFDCFEVINPLPVSLTFGNSADPSKFYACREKSSIRKFISMVAPDVVHIHTIMGLPVEFLEVLKEKHIKIVYTTHDYYGLCPKILSNDPLKELGSSKCSYDCMMCHVGPNNMKIKVMQSHLYQRLKNTKIFTYLRKSQRQKVNAEDADYSFNMTQINARYRLRKYYLNLFSKIDFFHFNSTVSEKVFKQYFPDIKGKVVPLTIKGLSKHNRKKRKSETLTFGFLGGTDPKKGISVIENVTRRLERSGLLFNSLCAGSDSNNSLFEEKNVTNLGIIPRNKIHEFYNKIDVLIVPSLWHETFGLVVIEALSNNVPVICSSNVGAKDILPAWCVFSSEFELFSKLETLIYSMDKRNELYKEVLRLKFDTNFAQHAEKIKDNFYE